MNTTPAPNALLRLNAYAMRSVEWHIELLGGLAALGALMSDRDTTVLERQKSARQPVLLAPNASSVPLTAVLRGTALPEGSILELKLVGPMLNNGDVCAWGMDEFAEAIRMADINPKVVGTLIYANTPGGEALAGQTLHNAIESSKKPVVVLADALHSAGVYGTVAADEIIATGAMSSIGSIGVYYSLSKEFLEWYHANVLDVYAPESAEKNAEFRALLAGDTSGFEKKASQSAQQFQKLVRTNRPLSGDIDSTLRGGTFNAKEARQRGLIDTINGDKAYAIRRIHYYSKHKKG